MNIIPAILEKDLNEIKKKLDFLSFVKKKYNLSFNFVQIDFCDGNFVDNITWLPTKDNIEQSRILLDYKIFFDIEYHLMCNDQYKYLEFLRELRAKSVVLHIDNIFNSTELYSALDYCRENMITIKVTGKLDFIISNKEGVVRFLDENPDVDLQMMGINNIGLQGQAFDDRCLELIRFFRNNFNKQNMSIQVDGSINQHTSKEVYTAGADAIVVGSYLMRDMDEFKFVSNFKKII